MPTTKSLARDLALAIDAQDFVIVSNAINRFCTDVHIPQSVQLQHEYTVELIGDPKRDVYAEMVEGMAADPILVPDFAGRGELTEDGPVENPARDRAVVAALERIKQRKARRPRPGNAKATPMMGGRASELGRAREVAGEYEDEDEDGSGLDDRRVRRRLDDDDDGEEAVEMRRRGAHYMPEAESAASIGRRPIERMPISSEGDVDSARRALAAAVQPSSVHANPQEALWSVHPGARNALWSGLPAYYRQAVERLLDDDQYDELATFATQPNTVVLVEPFMDLFQYLGDTREQRRSFFKALRNFSTAIVEVKLKAIIDEARACPNKDYLLPGLVGIERVFKGEAR
ncbi:hypothetical protein CAPTEDRAFT_189396, partial [Capitella teleta]